jgi:hypothetical protein
VGGVADEGGTVWIGDADDGGGDDREGGGGGDPCLDLNGRLHWVGLSGEDGGDARG